MQLAHYMRIARPRERERLARDCGTTVGYLYQIAGGHRRAGVRLALRLEQATGGAVCRCRLRPDLFPPGDCLGQRLSGAPCVSYRPVWHFLTDDLARWRRPLFVAHDTVSNAAPFSIGSM